MIESHTNIAATYIETKASIRASGTVDSGPVNTQNAAMRASTTPRASRRCAGLGGRRKMVKSCPSEAPDRVFIMLSNSTTERAGTVHVVWPPSRGRYGSQRLAPFRRAESARIFDEQARSRFDSERARITARSMRLTRPRPRSPGRRSDDAPEGKEGVEVGEQMSIPIAHTAALLGRPHYVNVSDCRHYFPFGPRGSKVSGKQ